MEWNRNSKQDHFDFPEHYSHNSSASRVAGRALKLFQLMSLLAIALSVLSASLL